MNEQKIATSFHRVKQDMEFLQEQIEALRVTQERILSALERS